MNTFYSISEFKSKKPTVLTIGTFDGMHIGHQKILDKVFKVAADKKLASLVLTFFPHPRMVLQKESDIKLIHTIDERKAILEESGLESLIIHPFSKEFSRLTATEFVRDILVKKLNIKHIIIGYDHRFGRNRTANIEDLKDFGELYGFTVEEISVQDINEVAVSSTKIRKAINEGDLMTANKYLGSQFELNGVITRGKGIGKTINFPTANIQIKEDYKIIPKNGVYIARALINGKELRGMMNIGSNPTVNGETNSIEIHLFDFNEDVYNKEISVKVLKRIRDEQKFDSIAFLQNQLVKDQQEAINYFNKNE
ncbi:bifunctional riboflavin kinase/FAD synthetase [Pseudofulvibacter geojedonensis]|uniref:Riboflavin biosynthesis protein n=1 Tax=Pseudofulvibacter geojedonensis TaxID=1123758 RepID=A0ABW3I3L8_9FLAO